MSETSSATIQTTYQRKRSGRTPLPLGKAVQGTPLRAPPSLKCGTEWPPTVDAARRSLGRNAMRSAAAYFNLGAALAHRGIQHGREGLDDLIEGYAIFSRIADSENAHHFKHYRALALYNATEAMKAMPAKAARGIAGDLLLRSVQAIGDSIVESMRQAFLGSAEALEERRKPEPLRWWKGRPALLPATPEGRPIVAAMANPIEGSWPGVRTSLLNAGLLAPLDCVVPAGVVLAIPEGRMIRVRSA